jgi:hypothetical protein
MLKYSAVGVETPVAMEDPIVLFMTSRIPAIVTYTFLEFGQEYGFSESLRLNDTIVNSLADWSSTRSPLVREDVLPEMSPPLSAFSRSTCFSISASLTASRLDAEESDRTRFSGIWLLGVFWDSGVSPAESGIVVLDSRNISHLLHKAGRGSCLLLECKGEETRRARYW